LNIKISNEAVDWYKEELTLSSGAYIRFFVRYGGHSNIQAGFSLGISQERPVHPIVLTEQDGVTFFIEENDLWFFDGHDLIIGFNEKLGEPEFSYAK